MCYAGTPGRGRKASEAANSGRGFFTATRSPLSGDRLKRDGAGEVYARHPDQRSE